MVRRHIVLDDRLDKLIQAEMGGSRELSKIVSEALWARYAKSDRSGRRHEYMELQLVSRGKSTPDQMMEWLLARRPMVGDLMPSGGELDARLQRVIEGELSPLKGRRVLMRLEGKTYAQIGQVEGCSKQAVHVSLIRATKQLGESRAFAEALIRALKKEEEYTPEMLLMAARRRENAGAI